MAAAMLGRYISKFARIGAVTKKMDEYKTNHLRSADAQGDGIAAPKSSLGGCRFSERAIDEQG